MPQAETQGQAQAAVTTEAAGDSLLDQIVEEGRFGSDAAARERGKDLIKQLRVRGARRAP